MLLSVSLEVYPWHIVFFLPLFRLLPLALTLCVFAIDSGEHGKGSLNDDICATWVVWFLHVFLYCWLLVSLIVLILLLKCLSLCNHLDVCQCFTTRRIIAAGWVNYLAPAVINSKRLLSSYHQRYAAQYGELSSWYIASFITIFISLAMKTCLTGFLPSLAPWPNWFNRFTSFLSPLTQKSLTGMKRTDLCSWDFCCLRCWVWWYVLSSSCCCCCYCCCCCCYCILISCMCLTYLTTHTLTHAYARTHAHKHSILL